MRNILYLIIMIIAVGVTVAYSVNIFKGKKITEPPVTVQTQPAQAPKVRVVQPPLIPQVALPSAGVSTEEDLYNRIDALERDLNIKLGVIAQSSDNKEVMARFDQLSKELESDVTMILSTINKKEQWYRNEFYQVLMGLGAVFIFLTGIILMAYISLKKLIVRNAGAAGARPALTLPDQPGQTSGENPILAAVGNVSVHLAELVSENRFLFDPEKSLRLSPAQKNSLTEITDEILFLDKAGSAPSSEEYYLLGLERFAEKSYDESMTLFDHIKEADPEFSLAWFMTGYIHYLSREFEQAEADMAKACAMEPGNTAYLVNYGNVCLKQKKYAEASSALEKAAHKTGDDATLWNNLAHAYIMAGNAEKAAEAFKTAAELRPDFNEALHNLGLTYSKMGKYDEAAKAFEKAIEIKPDKHESMYNAACVYAILGEREKALAHLKRAIAISSEYAEKAREDEDFSGFADDPDFKEITK